jgi:periplasmic protein TonB
MSLAALAFIALALEEPKFACRTELPRNAAKAKLRTGNIPSPMYPDIHHQYGDETVQACVEVGVDGRVKSCTASGGSNHDVNTQTCKLIMRWFRFYPATDRKKRPINSFVIQKFIWKLPEE